MGSRQKKFGPVSIIIRDNNSLTPLFPFHQIAYFSLKLKMSGHLGFSYSCQGSHILHDNFDERIYMNTWGSQCNLACATCSTHGFDE